MRRKVIRAGMSYAITMWLVLQVFELVLPAFDAPAWVLKVLIAVLVLGLPVVLVLSWAFDIETSITETSSDGESPARGGGVNLYLAIVLSVAVAYILFSNFFGPEDPVYTTDQVAAKVTLADDKSIAVLPFKNLSAAGENLYFSDGVMEAILNELSLIRDLKVVSRTSVETYRDTDKSVSAIARELGVANILEGSVQRAGDQIRVTAQLIAAAEDKHMWSRNFDRDLSDIFAIQSEIAASIAENLELILTSDEIEQLRNSPTSELRAYDLYLRARFGDHAIWGAERAPAESREALLLCEQARDLDPKFALAYACIAEAWFFIGKSEFVPLAEWKEHALGNVNMALKINPRQWEAYALLSDMYAALGEVGESIQYAKKVLQINPNHPASALKVGFSQAGTSEGMDMILTALELMAGGSIRAEAEELVPNFSWLAPAVADAFIKKYQLLESPSPDVLNFLASEALLKSNYKEYLRAMQEINKQLPTPNNLINLGVAYLFAGDYENARSVYEQVIARQGGDDESFLKWPFKHRYAYTLIKTGEEERGLALMHEYKDQLLQSVRSGKAISGNKGAYYDLAVIYAALGNAEEAMSWLNEARRHEREGAFFNFDFVSGDTMLAPVRGLREYKDLHQEISQADERIREMFKDKLAQRQSEGKLLWLTEAS